MQEGRPLEGPVRRERSLVRRRWRLPALPLSPPVRAGFPRRMPHRCCHDSCYLELGCKAPHAPELLLKHLCGGCCLCANTRPLVCPCSLFCMHVSVPMADESNPPTLCTSRAQLGAVALCYGAGSTCDSPFFHVAHACGPLRPPRCRPPVPPFAPTLAGAHQPGRGFPSRVAHLPPHLDVSGT